MPSIKQAHSLPCKVNLPLTRCLIRPRESSHSANLGQLSSPVADGPARLSGLRSPSSEGFARGEPLVLTPLFFPTAQVCPLPPMVSHGDFVCHPRPCDRYNHGTVVEFYCDPGYSLTSDYKYITCQYGEWFPSYQVYCIKSGEPPRPARAPWPAPQK